MPRTAGTGATDERPDVRALEKELAVVRERGFAINKDRTESGVTAVGSRCAGR